MEPSLDQKVRDLETKIDLIYVSVEKTRKYILWTAIITIAIIVLPLIGLLFAIPSFLSTFNDINSLGL